MRHGINITTNERLSPTFRGNGNTIIVGDSQTSPLPIFPDGGGDFCTQAKSKADSTQPSTNNHSYCMSRTTKPQYLRNKVLFAVKNIRIKLLLTLLQKYIKFLRNLISLNNNALQLCYFLYCKEKYNTLKILYLLQSVSLTFKTKKAAEDPYFSLINNTIKIIVPKRFRTEWVPAQVELFKNFF